MQYDIAVSNIPNPKNRKTAIFCDVIAVTTAVLHRISP